MKNNQPAQFNKFPNSQMKSTRFSIAGIMGVLSILLGLLFLFDPTFSHPFWLFLILAFTSCMFLYQGFRLHRAGLVITGSIILFLCFAGFLILNFFGILTIIQKVGWGLITLGAIWLMIIPIWYFLNRTIAWWIMLPSLIFLGTGCGFVFSHHHWTDLLLWPMLGLSIAMLIWSLGEKKTGLAIAGSLSLSASLGIYLGWRDYAGELALKSIGIMLVIFSLGWGLMILFWRVIKRRSIWWPLIPAGVLAFAGWGLVIGGSPGSALPVITHTSSIMLIILGIYLLLLRGNLNQK